MKLTIESLKARSTRAVCGVFEREAVIPRKDLAKAKSLIKSKGWVWVGSGQTGNPSTVKIWWSPKAF